MANIIYSLISFIVAIFFIALGIVCSMIPWSPDIRYSLVRFILEDALAISLFGFAFLIIGMAIAANILIGSRRRYYYVKSGQNVFQIDESIVFNYLNTYLEHLFPKKEIPCRLTLKKNKISITVDLPYIAEEKQKDLLDRIQSDLHELFKAKLGYQDEFYLTASFKKS